MACRLRLRLSMWKLLAGCNCDLGLVRPRAIESETDVEE